MLETLLPSAPPAAPLAITLYCDEGGSDKEYQVTLVPAGSNFNVNYRNGPRGRMNAGGTKTSAGPVSFDAAVKIVRTILKEKLGKGYKPVDACGGIVDYVAPDDTGVRPMLLEAVDLDDPRIDGWINDTAFGFQQKFDGERRMIGRELTGEVFGINRRGMKVAVAPELVAEMKKLPIYCLLDGELVGDRFHVWDIVSSMGVSMVNNKDAPYSLRLSALGEFIGGLDSRVISCATTVQISGAKRSLLEELKQTNAEGFVIKRMDALYVPGKTHAGVAMKVKFWADLSAVVSKANSSRSVSLSLLDGDSWIDVGNVTIPANYPVPAIGDVVDVRYLYAYQQGSLFQPVYRGPRRDIDKSECLASQRKFKPDDRQDDAA